MTYTAHDIAKYIITKRTERNIPVNNLGLQRILYLLQSEFLSNRGEPLFTDDFQTRRFGPIVPDVYYKYCSFGAEQIRMKYEDLLEIEGSTREIVESIALGKSELKPWDYIDITQKRGGAWDTVFRSGRGDHKVISKELIRTLG